MTKCVLEGDFRPVRDSNGNYIFRAAGIAYWDEEVKLAIAFDNLRRPRVVGLDRPWKCLERCDSAFICQFTMSVDV